MATITTTKMAPQAQRRWWRQGLLGCGVVSSVLYVATDVVASLRYPGYSYADQQISELLAKGAPSRPFMGAANLIPYDLLVGAFAMGIWASAGRTRAGRITAAMLVGFAVFGTLGGGFFEMDRREVLAAGQDTLRSTMHLPVTKVMALCILLAMGFGSRLLGKRFRYYSYATIAAVLAFGLLAAAQAGALATNEPTPLMGIEERVSSYGMMLWTALLAVGLLRAQSPTGPRPLGRPAVSPQPVSQCVERRRASADNEWPAQEEVATMASTISAQTRIRSSVPSIRVLRAINPFVSAILRSPLHGLLSKQVMLLTYTGRKTGKRYTIPVGYVCDGEMLVVFSSRSWRRNLRGGAAVEVLVQGRRSTGTAVPIEDPEEVEAAVERTIARYGRKGATWRTGITLDATPPPTREEIAQAMRGRAVIRIRLERR